MRSGCVAPWDSAGDATVTKWNVSDPYGIRTRVTCVKGGCPRPLDEGVLVLVRVSLEGLEPFISSTNGSESKPSGQNCMGGATSRDLSWTPTAASLAAVLVDAVLAGYHVTALRVTRELRVALPVARVRSRQPGCGDGPGPGRRVRVAPRRRNDALPGGSAGRVRARRDGIGGGSGDRCRDCRRDRRCWVRPCCARLKDPSLARCAGLREGRVGTRQHLHEHRRLLRPAEARRGAGRPCRAGSRSLRCAAHPLAATARR